MSDGVTPVSTPSTTPPLHQLCLIVLPPLLLSARRCLSICPSIQLNSTRFDCLVEPVPQIRYACLPIDVSGRHLISIASVVSPDSYCLSPES
jgi:hypothetical protein